MTAEDLEQLSILRVALSTQALRIAIPRMRSTDLAKLEGCAAELAYYASAKNDHRWILTYKTFQRTLAMPAGRRISDTLGQLFDHTERYHRLCLQYGSRPWAKFSYRDMLDACGDGDRDRGVALFATYFASTTLEVSALLYPSYTPARLSEALVAVGAELPQRSGRAGLGIQLPAS